MVRLLVLSDIHYASPAEKRRPGYEWAAPRRPVSHFLLRLYRRHVWLRDPFAHNGLLDQFLELAGEPDWVVANGDFSCDSAFIGVADDAAAESARMCLDRLRSRFGSRFVPVMGDHELGKISLVGGLGGLRLASWYRATEELAIDPLWMRDLGTYTAIGLTSTLPALPVYQCEALPEERSRWWELREQHLHRFAELIEGTPPDRRLILFVHDPTALPFLGELPAVRARLERVALTIIGHLHSPLVYWQSRVLAGLPPIRFLGNAIRRMSEALSRARAWKQFRLRLCPSLAGIELLKDGGYLELRIPESGTDPLEVHQHRIWRKARIEVC